MSRVTDGGRFCVRAFDGPDDRASWARTVIFDGQLSNIAQHLALAIQANRPGPDGVSLWDIQELTGWRATVVRDVVADLCASGHLQRQRVLCSYCATWIEGRLSHNDHVVARSLGGEDDADNRVPTCKSCNSKKSAKPLLFWLMEIGRIS